MKRIFKQLIFIIICLAIGMAIQSLLFKNPTNGWMNAWMTYPALWIVYFLLSHVICERILRAKK